MTVIDQLSGYLTSSPALTFSLATAAIILLLSKKLLEKYRYPPGPIPLPLIGNDYHLMSDGVARYKYSKVF